MRRHLDKVADSAAMQKANDTGGSVIVWGLAILFLAAAVHIMDMGDDGSVTHPVKLWRSVVNQDGDYVLTPL